MKAQCNQDIKLVINLTSKKEYIKSEIKHQLNKKITIICQLHWYKIKKRFKNLSMKGINRYRE